MPNLLLVGGTRWVSSGFPPDRRWPHGAVMCMTSFMTMFVTQRHGGIYSGHLCVVKSKFIVVKPPPVLFCFFCLCSYNPQFETMFIQLIISWVAFLAKSSTNHYQTGRHLGHPSSWPHCDYQGLKITTPTGVGNRQRQDLHSPSSSHHHHLPSHLLWWWLQCLKMMTTSPQCQWPAHQTYHSLLLRHPPWYLSVLRPVLRRCDNILLRQTLLLLVWYIYIVWGRMEAV